MQRRRWGLVVVAAALAVGQAVGGTASGEVGAVPDAARFEAPVDVGAGLPPRASLTAPLEVANWWRSLAGRYPDGAALPALTADADLAASSQRHVDYLAYLRTVGSTYCGHGTDPAFPPLDPGSRTHNVLFCTMDPIEAIDGWMATPLHGQPFVSPRSAAMGLGWNASSGSAAGFRSVPLASQPREPYVFPRPGGILPRLDWWGGEIPNPADSCPPAAGVINGQPASIFLPPYDNGNGLRTTYRAIAFRVVDGAGAVVPACLMSWVDRVDGGQPFSGDAYVFPTRPWAEGGQYRVEVTFQPTEPSGATYVDSGTPLSMAWSFTTSEAASTVSTVRRLLDTRAGAAPVAGQVVELGVGGTAGVPIDASTVVLNVTATESAAAGFVTVWPCGQPRPLASNLNVVAGQTIANTVFTRPGTNGRVCLYAHSRMHLVVDLQGWFPIGFQTTGPVRVLETRAAGQTGWSGGEPSAGTVVELPIGGTNGVPADASAVVLNVTATEGDAGGFVTVWPCGEARPLASNVNHVAGQTIPNVVVTRPGAGGKVCLYTLSRTHLVADLAGWFSSGYHAGAPTRILETRAAGQTGYAGGKPAAGQVVTLAVAGAHGVPLGASAVVLNVTATEAGANGFVTVWPCGAARPLASNLNSAVGQSIPNVVVVTPAADGTVCLYTLTSAHLVADLQGWFD